MKPQIRRIALSLFPLFFLFLPMLSWATSYPEGYYMSLQDILDRKPSSTDYHLEIESIYPNDTLLEAKEFWLFSPDKSVKTRFIRKKIMAYSDGKNLFLNQRIAEGGNKFMKVEDEGHFLVFTLLGAPPGAVAAGGVAGGLVGGMAVGAAYSSHKRVFVLNTSNGIISGIDKAAMKEILAYFPELEVTFQETKNKSSYKVLMDYTIQVNRAFDGME